MARAPDEIKTFRVSRVEEVALLDEPVERPRDFDLARWWGEWSDAFETGLARYPVTVRVAPAAVGRLYEFGDAVTRAPKEPAPTRDSDGWERRVLVFERPEWAESALLQFGAAIEVVDPPELRNRLESAAADLYELYQ